MNDKIAYTTISKAQLEVWEWKENAAESVMHLPVGERIKFIMERAKKTVDELQSQGVLKSSRPIKRRQS